MKIDRFTWGIVAVVVALLAAAVVTVNLTKGSGVTDQQYIEEDKPETPVFNAFLALQKGDVFKAREQYTQRVLDEMKKDGYDQFSGRSGDRTARRLRIEKVEVYPDKTDRALVSFVQDNYNNGGLFGSGEMWSRTGAVEVVREDGQWKIDAPELFY